MSDDIFSDGVQVLLPERLRKDAGPGAPMMLLKSMMPDEESEILSLVTGEEDEDEGQVRHPETGRYITAADAEGLVKAGVNPMLRLALERQIALARAAGVSKNQQTIRKESDDVGQSTLDQNIEKLAKCMEDARLDPRLRDECGQVVSKYRLAKSIEARQVANVVSKTRADDERAAANQSIRAAQAGGLPMGPSAVRPSAESALRAVGSGNGTPLRLGQVSPLGNRGDLLGHQGQTEAPTAQTKGELFDELSQTSDPVQKERIAERLTLLNLREAFVARRRAL